MTIIIAEAGSNHNGSKDQAIELVQIAKRAGADYCKFQFIGMV
jgi:N,N'-diacetyllegionaminate synthase